LQADIIDSLLQGNEIAAQIVIYGDGLIAVRIYELAYIADTARALLL